MIFSSTDWTGWRVVPEQDTVVFDRLDDFFRPLKLFLRTVGEADVDAIHEIHPGQFLDDVLHGGRGEVVEQRWDDHPNRHTPRRTQNTFFHAPQVLIDQAREGRDDVLLKVGHASAYAQSHELDNWLVFGARSQAVVSFPRCKSMKTEDPSCLLYLIGAGRSESAPF